ncbi:TPA: hypothetical protein KOY34_003633 [Clostridioides difficile]|uniref:hypothetical protein n=1 Tax=Clostridioides difficile TaxID=1496 RepID=UPI00097FE01A|nr:hypothetical protein [Clostridioides difficile]SJR59667.1 Uncharacterised protein [Clostridioides difficile]SJS03176.1 Uncharacterised protein [Clostridioides difficile]SJT66951.1 Uncharacterised protein [Clostridioides difficile]VFC70678.1 Uncharacterised protein [Clostridioides difficile]VHX61186.1 Uncharacterised protein [Clostridioides difficile]
MDEFVECNRCGRIINTEEDGCVKYEKENLGIIVTLNMCLDCLEELLEDAKFLV